MDTLLIHLFIRWLIYRVMSMSYHFFLGLSICYMPGAVLLRVKQWLWSNPCLHVEGEKKLGEETTMLWWVYSYDTLQWWRRIGILNEDAVGELAKGKTQGTNEGSGSRIDFAGRRDVGSRRSCKTVGRLTAWGEGKVTHHCQSPDHRGNIRSCERHGSRKIQTLGKQITDFNTWDRKTAWGLARGTDLEKLSSWQGSGCGHRGAGSEWQAAWRGGRRSHGGAEKPWKESRRGKQGSLRRWNGTPRGHGGGGRGGGRQHPGSGSEDALAEANSTGWGALPGEVAAGWGNAAALNL